MATRSIKPRVKVKPRVLNINRAIDDIDIWHVRIESPQGTFNMPVGKTDLQSLFEAGKGDWNVTVLGRFIKGSPLNFIKY